MANLVVAIIAVMVAVFTMQNTEPVTVTLLIWQIERVPLAAVVLFSLGAGIIIVGVPLWFQRWRLQSRLRSMTPPAPPPGDKKDTV
jgi:uncharacterized integral membrane protein